VCTVVAQVDTLGFLVAVIFWHVSDVCIVILCNSWSSYTAGNLNLIMSYLQAIDKVKLKIYANSTRRALWHAKLGFHRRSRPPIMSLHSLFGDGGPVPGVDVVVGRIYPVLVCITVICHCIKLTV